MRASVVLLVLLGVCQSLLMANDLDKIYGDESHCLVAPEIRSEKDKPISCYCRDALIDARYVYQTYLLTGKDRNLGGIYLALEIFAGNSCGEGYDISRATMETGWKWNGPEVIRKYPGDREVEERRPNASAIRTVVYQVKLFHHDAQGRVTKVESFAASERLPPSKR